MAADFFWPWIDTTHHDIGAIQFAWTGADAITAHLIPQATIVGTQTAYSTCWCDLVAGSSIKKVDAASGCHLYDFTSIGYKALRLKFLKQTNTTGTIDTFVMLKRRRPG